MNYLWILLWQALIGDYKKDYLKNKEIIVLDVNNMHLW